MTATWWSIDHGHDRTHASDNYSRYGAYLVDRLNHAVEDEALDDPERWTAWCWWVATPPIMRPGYVTLADPIRATTLDRDPETGRLAATVVAAAPLPPRIDRSWRTWHADLRRRLAPGTPPTALCIIEFHTVLDAPMGGWASPPADPQDRRQLVTSAKHAVQAATAALNPRFAADLETLARSLGLCRQPAEQLRHG
jgi:hypothetical protein